MTEAERKRRAALGAVGPFATNDPADVRWLLCGRGRPVSAGSSPYTVVVDKGRAYPWHEAPPVASTRPDLAALRRALGPEDVDRYRSAGADAAVAFTEGLSELRPEQSEYGAVAELTSRLHARGFTTPVALAGGEARAPVHPHPLPTSRPLGRFALLAVTAERDGLYVSMTRVVSFGPPPAELEERVSAAAEVDAAVLAASRPGRTLGELFAVVARAYEEQGRPEEWRRHHQGGIAG